MGATIVPPARAILSALLDDLLDADEAARSARLQQIRSESEALANELQRLLAQETAIHRARFLEGSALDAMHGATAALAGTVIGRYTLDRPLGAGGMSSVWLAHRSDGRFEGEAAVKFLDLALLGRGGAERFHREGSALARLAHPNLARLLDAGVTAGGQPFLVLEYVDGQPIDRWCNERALGMRARVQLMQQVMHAVAHAHRNLVLHRDIKPGNILVTADGQVKLLDFGIAKLLGDATRPARQTELTQHAGRAFTPDYAAPEQVQGADVTTATDVYALGVLLYTLLGGAHPTAKPTHTPVDRLRAVVETVPQRLSEVAEHERGALRGDLDNIVGKALKKDPGERYATVDAFADDLRRYLHHEPVSARADSLAYRAAKFARRHRIVVGAALTVALAVVAGVMGTVWQAVESARQRDRALVQLQRAETAAGFVTVMLYNTWGPEERITLGEFLVRSEELALRSLENQPEQQAVVLDSLGSYYFSLGDLTRAEPLLRRATSILPPSADVSLRARVECNHALVIGQQGGADAARKVIGHWVAQVDLEPEVAARCAMYGAQLAWISNDAQEALRQAFDAERLLRKAPRASPVLRAELLSHLGYGYEMNNRIADADREYAAAIDAFNALGRADSAVAMVTLNNWGRVSWSAGDTKHALELIDRTIGLAGRRGATHVVPPYAASNRAAALVALGRYTEALEAAERAIVIAEKANAMEARFRAMLAKAGALSERRDFPAAESTIEAAAALARALPAGSFDPFGLTLRRARIALLRGQPAETRTLVQPLIEPPETRPKAGATLALALRLRADALTRMGEHQAALADAQAALAISQQMQGGRRHSLPTGQAWLLLARIKHDTADLAGSRADAVRAAEHLDAMLDDNHPDCLLAHRLASE
jgi:tetratricopeptide (TPR) repeat protein